MRHETGAADSRAARLRRRAREGVPPVPLVNRTVRPRRSVLFMPASNARALEKARTLPADALVFDLEDAVAPDAKESARVMAREAAHSRGYGRREIVIRAN